MSRTDGGVCPVLSRAVPQRDGRYRGDLGKLPIAGTVGVIALLAAPAVSARAGTSAALPITSFSQIVADSAHGHLFISQGSSSINHILVTDLAGNEVASIAGQDGVLPGPRRRQPGERRRAERQSLGQLRDPPRRRCSRHRRQWAAGTPLRHSPRTRPAAGSLSPRFLACHRQRLPRMTRQPTPRPCARSPPD